jgi:hypothetical protein
MNIFHALSRKKTQSREITQFWYLPIMAINPINFFFYKSKSLQTIRTQSWGLVNNIPCILYVKLHWILEIWNENGLPNLRFQFLSCRTMHLCELFYIPRYIYKYLAISIPCKFFPSIKHCKNWKTAENMHVVSLGANIKGIELWIKGRFSNNEFNHLIIN